LVGNNTVFDVMILVAKFSSMLYMIIIL